MADVSEEANTQSQSQAHGCSSYSLSLPSQPPDIKNWFSSYEYESPEDSEVTDPGGDNGSETQDPLEYRVSEHSLLKHDAPQDCRATLGENLFRGQSDHEVSAIRDFVPIGKPTVEHGAKRKQSLRDLFGVDFLDDTLKVTEPESPVVLAAQRNGVHPLANCNPIGLPDAERGQEGAVEHSKKLADRTAINLVDTPECFPGDQKTENTKLPVNCDAISSAGTEKSFLEDSTEHNKLSVKCNSTLADTVKSSKHGIEHDILPANRHGIGPADIKGSSSRDEISCSKSILQCKVPEETVAADGFVAIKRKEKQVVESKTNKIPKPSIGGENATTSQGNRINLAQKVLAQGRTRSPLADRTNLSEVAAAPAPEISGKWKCPRKGKPYVAPPMKQMRLEQWVRRMN